MREKAERRGEKTSLFNRMQKTIGDVFQFPSAVRPWGITQSTSFPPNPQTSWFPDHIKDYMALQEHIEALTPHKAQNSQSQIKHPSLQL